MCFVVRHCLRRDRVGLDLVMQLPLYEWSSTTFMVTITKGGDKHPSVGVMIGAFYGWLVFLLLLLSPSTRTFLCPVTHVPRCAFVNNPAVQITHSMLSFPT